MFTGIVAEMGTVRHVAETASGRRIEVACSAVLARLAVGDSVSVSGTCLTVVDRDDRGFAADAVPETLARTTLGRAVRGTHVNLEAAATPDTALGGHFMQGHVDGTTELVSRTREGDGARLRFRLPRELSRYVVLKGSIAVDGVSVTVAALPRGAFEVAVIPHTAQVTTLGALREGERVNIEVDMIAKYVERLLGPRARR
ncbi:MAG TPA: riboflavin synthase [Candidatus Limnocylindria bacterium]|nr:riboflavin synthase [Candidatus Limnocylindria bacterium]